MWHTKLYNSVDHYGISTEGKQEIKLRFMLIKKINFTALWRQNMQSGYNN